MRNRRHQTIATAAHRIGAEEHTADDGVDLGLHQHRHGRRVTAQGGDRCGTGGIDDLGDGGTESGAISDAEYRAEHPGHRRLTLVLHGGRRAHHQRARRGFARGPPCPFDDAGIVGQATRGLRGDHDAGHDGKAGGPGPGERRCLGSGDGGISGHDRAEVDDGGMGAAA